MTLWSISYPTVRISAVAPITSGRPVLLCLGVAAHLHRIRKESDGGRLTSNWGDEDFMLVDAYTLADDLTFEPNNPDVIRCCVTAERTNARQVRSSTRTCGPASTSPISACGMSGSGTSETTIRASSIFIARMQFECFWASPKAQWYRATGWHFFQLGRFVERAQLLAALVDAPLAIFPAGELHVESNWHSLLQICEASGAYRRLHSLEYRPSTVVDFLVADELLSHSIRYALARISEALFAIVPEAQPLRAPRTGARGIHRRQRYPPRHRSPLVACGNGLQAPRNIPLRAGKHRGRFADQEHSGDRPGCLSGLHPCHDRHCPFLGNPEPLRVSGYLHLEGVTGEQALAGVSHSWAEFLLPYLGWIGIDPTNDTLTDHRHVRVAVGRDYADPAPTRGLCSASSGSDSRCGSRSSKMTSPSRRPNCVQSGRTFVMSPRPRA